MSARATLLAMLAGTALIAAPLCSGHTLRFVWNASASLPIGVYRLEPGNDIAVTDIALVAPPEPIANYLARRGYLPRNVPMLKRVLALAGTTVCRSGTTIVAYDHAYGEALERDSFDRPLPVWQGCRRLRDGEAFFMNWQAEDSFDGRYFGPLPDTSIVARAVPLWIDADGDGRFRWHAADPDAAP